MPRPSNGGACPPPSWTAAPTSTPWAGYSTRCSPGEPPFHAENLEGWMYQHLQGVPEPLELLRPELAWEHSAMEAIVMRLLAREREQRFPSAAAVLEVLSMPPPAPRHVTVAEESPAFVPEANPTTERSGSPVWVIAAILIAICLGIWAGVRFLPPLLVTAAPVLTPVEGTYAEAQPVTISDTTPFATIHYTVDGSQPKVESPSLQAAHHRCPAAARSAPSPRPLGHAQLRSQRRVSLDWSNPAEGQTAGTQRLRPRQSRLREQGLRPGADAFHPGLRMAAR
jgi:hypothetical protein